VDKGLFFNLFILSCFVLGRGGSSSQKLSVDQLLSGSDVPVGGEMGVAGGRGYDSGDSL